MKTHLGALFLALGLLLSPNAVQASLIGDTVGCNITGGSDLTCSSATAVVVDTGVEFQIGNIFGPFFNIDFRSNDVLFTAVFANSLSGTIVNLNDLTHAFTTASLLSSSGVNGFDAGDISLNMGTLLVEFRDTDSAAGATIDIALTTTAAVPAPASLVLLGSALAVYCAGCTARFIGLVG